MKDFISETTSVDHMSSNQVAQKPQYIGQDYENQYNLRVSELEAHFAGSEKLDIDQITMLRESCLLIDEIMTNAETLDELKGEIALEVIGNHENSLKSLKKLFRTDINTMSEKEKEVIFFSNTETRGALCNTKEAAQGLLRTGR